MVASTPSRNRRSEWPFLLEFLQENQCDFAVRELLPNEDAPCSAASTDRLPVRSRSILFRKSEIARNNHPLEMAEDLNSALGVVVAELLLQS
jgi:hypothetical protein